MFCVTMAFTFPICSNCASERWAETVDEQLNKASELWRKSISVVVFTGAGISVESGIPDFRSPGGLWDRFDPEIYAHFETFQTEPKLFWEMTEEVEKLLESAQPNSAHLSLAQLEQIGKVKAIVTQNIDNLHQAAGSSIVYELHGNAKRIKCSNRSCKEPMSLQDLKEIRKRKEIPTCKKCNGLVKTDVILFGEMLPQSVIYGAMAEIANCDLLVMIGSSLEVSPANTLPAMAKENGAQIIFVNKDPTRMDSIADIILRGKAGEILPQIVQRITQQSKH